MLNKNPIERMAGILELGENRLADCLVGPTTQTEQGISQVTVIMTELKKRKKSECLLNNNMYRETTQQGLKLRVE